MHFAQFIFYLPLSRLSNKKISKNVWRIKKRKKRKRNINCCIEHGQKALISAIFRLHRQTLILRGLKLIITYQKFSKSVLIFKKLPQNFFYFFSKGYDYSHSATTTMSPVNLKDCMEEVVRYTLESHINETLEFDLGLSKSFCSDLLKLDPNDPNTTTTSGNYLITSSSSSLI